MVLMPFISVSSGRDFLWNDLSGSIPKETLVSEISNLFLLETFS